LDFDGWDAVLAWFSSWEGVIEASKRTRIEWHGDKTRLHYFILADKPLPNRRIHVKDSLLEIRCERQAIFASPSIHKDGDQYSPIGSKGIPIPEINDTQLMGLQAQIDTLCKGYMSDEDKSKYIQYLHLPETIIGEHQGRHDATKTIINNYYWRYGGGWLELSDEERFERAWEWHISHCKPPRSREEFDKLCKWAIDTFEEARDKLHNEKREEADRFKQTEVGLAEGKLKLFRSYPNDVQTHLTSNYWTETSRDNWVVADTTENIIYRCYSTEVGEDDWKHTIFCKADRILKCIPVTIIKHENPFDYLGVSTTYTIEFRNTLNRVYTQSNVALDTIADWLKNEGYILPVGNRGGTLTQTLSAMVDAFREDDKLQVERSAHFEGYYYDQGDIQISKIDLAKKHPVPTTEECITCADFLEDRARFSVYPYNGKQIDRRDALATCIKWAIVAPFNFVIKQLTGKYLNALSFNGERDGGKTSMADEILDIHGNRTDDERLGGQSMYNLKAGDMNTEAKFGRCVDRTTYPIIGSEFGRIEGYGRDERLLETAKNAIEFTVCRSGRKDNRYDAVFMSAASLVFTGNAAISLRGELLKRIHNMKFSIEDRHEKANPNTIAFNEFMKNNRHKYKTLGDWTINYILDNKQELLFSKKYDAYQIMDIVIKAFYESIGRELPEWLSRWIQDTSLEEIDADEEGIIRSILFEHINNTIRQNYQIIFSAEEKERFHGLSMSERIDKCLGNDLLSYVRPVFTKQEKLINENGRIVAEYYEINSSIKMLFDNRLPDITLKKLGEKMRFDYTRNTVGKYVLRFTRDQLAKFIEGGTD
jgi:hypothetical protein